MEGEVVVVSHRDEVVREHLPKKFHSGLAMLARELGALTNLLCAQTISQISLLGESELFYGKLYPFRFLWNLE